jgi:hypothetical protein
VLRKLLSSFKSVPFSSLLQSLTNEYREVLLHLPKLARSSQIHYGARRLLFVNGTTLPKSLTCLSLLSSRTETWQ